jgi:hypothetical protein
MSHRALTLSAIVFGSFLPACGKTLADTALESAHAAVGEVGRAIVGEMTGIELNDDAPPTDCLPKNESSCYDVVDPEWPEAQNLFRPTTGSIRPPPGCGVCSPLSQPGIPVSRALPPYLMSEVCLIDLTRTRRVIR